MDIPAEQAALRKVLGPLGCQLRAGLWCALADLHEISTRMDPQALARVQFLAAIVVISAQARSR